METPTYEVVSSRLKMSPAWPRSLTTPLKLPGKAQDHKVGRGFPSCSDGHASGTDSHQPVDDHQVSDGRIDG